MQALQLNWPKCRKGYEVLELRWSFVDWYYAERDGSVPPPANATAAERRLRARWGSRLTAALATALVFGLRQGDIARVIEPRNEKMHVVNVLAAAPDLFIEFANINDSETRLLAFLDKHGPLYHSEPMEVSVCLVQAALFQKVLSQFENDKQTGSKRWLSSFEKLRRLRGIEINSGELKVVPKIDSGEIQVFLEPPDLLTAVWLQFLLKAANDMTLAHCHSCRNFIAVAGSLGRTDRKFCSAACKQRDYRRREAEGKASRSRAAGARRVANRRHST